MHIIIIGCGRVGSQLALLLAQEKHNIVIIDKDANAFKSLGTSFNGVKLYGYGYDEEILKEAGIERCDALAAVTDLDIHASTLEIVKIGRPVRHLFNIPRAIIAGFLLVVALVLYRLRIVIKHRYTFWEK